MSYDEEDYDEDYEEEHYTPMTPIDITLPEDALENIADRAAKRLADRLSDRAEEVLREKIQSVWDAELRAKVQSMAETFITDWVTQPRHETNIWGERTGKEQKTFSERILDEWMAYMKMPVRSDGKDADYHDRGRMSRAQWLIKKCAVDEIEAAATKAVSEVGKEARERTKEAVSAFIAQQLAPRVDGKLLERQ